MMTLPVRSATTGLALLALLAPNAVVADQVYADDRAPIGNQAPVSSPAPEPMDLPKPTGMELDLRVGSIEFGDQNGSRTTVGGRFAFYPWKGEVTRRLGVHIAGDFVQLSKVEGTLTGLPGLTETATYWYTIGTALGVDVIRTPRFVLDTRFGVAGDSTETRFALEGDDSTTTCVPGGGCFDSSSDGFVDVCDLVAFRNRCSDDTRAAGTLALGVRVWPVARVPWFVGLDYTWLTTGRSQILATIGVGPGRR